MLILYYANEGYRPVTISGDIAEADRVYDIDEKQVFYYDDFLGQTGLADKLSKNEDARLSEFISRISKTKQKRFILTTREYILQQSGLQYEKLDTLVRTTSFQYVLAMSQYSRLDKASILFNHLYFSRLDKTIQRELLVDRGYYKIIDHDNYNPRLLAGVIAQIERSPLQPGNLLQRILRTLDSPSELWSHPFERQLDLDARKFLLALLSLPVRVEVQDAIGAFSALLPASSAIEQKSRDCLRVLEDTFTKTEMINGVHLLSFHNPSVRDFLKGYVAANSAVLIELLDGANFFSQCEYLFELARPPHFAQFAPSVPVRTPPPEIHHADLATALFKTFVRTFRSNSCRIDVDHLQRASLVAKSYVNISERLATAVKITLSLELHDAARAWINEQLIEVGARWAENQNELEAAADLLELLKDTSLVTGERLGELAEHLGRLLWDWASSPEEFVLLSNFVGEFSESISEDSLSELAGRIVKSEIYSIRNDSDGVADAEARFEELKAFCKGQGLEIDPDDVRRVDESIADMQSSEDIRDDHYSGQSWQSPRSPSSDSDAPMIDAMFGLLSDDD